MKTEPLPGSLATVTSPPIMRALAGPQSRGLNAPFHPFHRFDPVGFAPSRRGSTLEVSPQHAAERGLQRRSCACSSASALSRKAPPPEKITFAADTSVTTAEPAIAVARDQVIDRVADHPWDEVEDPCPLPARKLARNAQRGFGFYIGRAFRRDETPSIDRPIAGERLTQKSEKAAQSP